MVGEDVCFWLAPNFGQKVGLNLSEDHFIIFWSSPNFEKKIRIHLSETMFILVCVLLKFSEVPGLPPSFQNSAYATAWKVYVKSHGNIFFLQSVAGSSGSVDTIIIRTGGLAMAFSAAEFASPFWHHSKHANKLGISLNHRWAS